MPIRRSRRALMTLVAVLTAAAGVLVAEPAQAGTSTGSVSGHVVTTDGSAAADVPVLLTTVVIHEYPEDPVDLSHVHTYTVSTDASGDYTVPDAQQGAYTVTVAPSSVWTVKDRVTATVAPGSTTAPTMTAIRLATIHGALAATEDGAAIGGADVAAYSMSTSAVPTSNDENVLSLADGGFTVHVPPGSVQLQVDASGRFEVARTVTVAEGGDLDLGTLDLDPSGDVVTQILGRSGHHILQASQSAVVDGCRVEYGLVSTCPGVVATFGMTHLQLAPGTHTVRYVVTGATSSVVRHVTRTFVVAAGKTTTLSPVVVRADPVTVAKVRAGTFRKGHPVVVRVDGPGYTDSTHPHLRTTFLVNGHAVTPTSVVWRAPAKGELKVLIATLPTSWSSRSALAVKAVVHGTDDYSATTTAATTLTRKG